MTKVKQVVDAVIPSIQERLLLGDVSIHRAWLWRTLNEKAQRDALWGHLNRRGLATSIRELVKRHKRVSPRAHATDVAPAIISGLATCDPADITVAVIDVPGRAVVVTRACYDDFRRRADAAR